MYELVVTALVYAFEVYLFAGVVFSIFFVRSWLDQLDPVAKGSTRGFRLIIIPGAIALWPWLWLRVRQHKSVSATESASHE